ncbi:uncharacterized protein LOC132562127 [Ylistrum balloti]|uniref:uncharacterized protein LOC132562127 n=1 Tax=Ylistrum balloti TaxID=509963 RepID=UPI002905EB5C|nr:uncharacterized protein LOC132562127 [Ylistrum balloti]
MRHAGKSDCIIIELGGCNLPVIIDSGASVNLIDRVLWEKLKSENIACKSEKTEKKLYAYKPEKPLDLLGKFSSYICLKGSDQGFETDFYVIKGKGPALIGCETAKRLGVLSLGVNLVEGDVFERYPECFSGFGKLTDYKLKLDIN